MPSLTPNRIRDAKLRLYGFTQAAAGYMTPADSETWSALVDELIVCAQMSATEHSAEQVSAAPKTSSSNCGSDRDAGVKT